MQNQISPIVLSFGATDPVSAIGIQADMAAFAAMGCHGVSVVTAILVGDTTQNDSMFALEPDLVDDQARALLEDMPIVAFKIGQLGSIENISAIAEIISDYPSLPLVFDPFSSGVSDSMLDPDDFHSAILEMLIPQTTLLLISAVELSRLAETWRGTAVSDDLNAQEWIAISAMELIETGCQYVLVTGVPSGSNDVANALFDESGVIRNDHWQRIEGIHVGAGNAISASIAALLANGLTVTEAVLEAQEFTLAAIQQSQRLGMGRLVLDRYFWTRDSEPIPIEPST